MSSWVTRWEFFQVFKLTSDNVPFNVLAAVFNCVFNSVLLQRHEQFSSYVWEMFDGELLNLYREEKWNLIRKTFYFMNVSWFWLIIRNFFFFFMAYKHLSINWLMVFCLVFRVLFDFCVIGFSWHEKYVFSKSYDWHRIEKVERFDRFQNHLTTFSSSIRKLQIFFICEL